ncbi:acetylglucosaminyltransferase [Volvox carteri f. nagariensis]|uniref:Acetylglucosaminyltransferase n=1 Tax=Volvox carteri f. nagariensis TaxID=3068 RepID=D8U625_VOLCA|nr:acetylglucosaminyltransferase [Volvox carteri f. nagariensis]EFJ44781.1 acetylglucosaminyltransferase [Volvox carteri f. nagariensis]|eukprot:XP_002954064.1 acetylglucosaminyltransferase [Volvox carteri f. nagariensis]
MTPMCHPHLRGALSAKRLQQACRPCFVASRVAPRLPGLLVVARSSKPASASKPQYQPTSARDAIETATRVFKEQQDVDEAVRLYRLGLDMKPNEDEARAALYNLGCALAKQKKWAEASDSIVKAINDYKLKLTVALKDEDLKQLRERREWIDALTQVKGGISRSTKVDLRTEAKAPFRLPRIILFGGLLGSAAIGLVIIVFRLVKALQGGPEAPDLNESLTNLGVNSVAVAVLSYLLYRDVSQKQEAVRITTREELMGRLQIDLGNDRVLPLLKFRGQVRPVIVAGTRSFVERAIKEADSQYINLRDRAVSVIPVIFESAPVGDVDPEIKLRALRKEFAKEARGFDESAAAAKKAAAEAAEARAARSKATVLGGLMDADKRWRLEPYAVDEWKAWILEQKEFAGLSPREPNCYIQVQLDGTVRSSGPGTPPWRQLVEDLPLLSDFRTRLMDGVGPQDCLPGCHVKGVCNEELATCFCPRHFTGPSCSDVASNIKDICATYGFTLSQCRKASPCFNSCNERGRCVAGICHCQPGYWGMDCAISWGPNGKMQLLDGLYKPRNGSIKIYVYELPPNMTSWPCADLQQFLTPLPRAPSGPPAPSLSPYPTRRQPPKCPQPYIGFFSRFNIRRLDRPLHLLFWQRLMSAGIRTVDGDEADYYFIPVNTRTELAPGMVEWVLSYIRRTYPWWSKDNGNRHLIIHTGDMGIADLPADMRSRLKSAFSNITWLTHWGIYQYHPVAKWYPAHRPGKDVVLPVMVTTQGFHLSPLNPRVEARARRRNQTMARSGTFFFAGRICGDRKPPDPATGDCSRTRPDYSGGVRQLDISSHKFCLAPLGGGHGKRQVLVSLMGCVPVLIGNGVLQPFEPEIDWSRFSVSVPEADIPDLPRILANISDQRVADMQAREKRGGRGKGEKGRGNEGRESGCALLHVLRFWFPLGFCGGLGVLKAGGEGGWESCARTCTHTRGPSVCVCAAYDTGMQPGHKRLRCAAQHMFYSSTLGAILGEDGRYGGWGIRWGLRVCGGGADAFETIIEILRVRKAHPDVPPEQYIHVDERFRKFVDCDLGGPDQILCNQGHERQYKATPTCGECHQHVAAQRTGSTFYSWAGGMVCCSELDMTKCPRVWP